MPKSDPRLAGLDREIITLRSLEDTMREIDEISTDIDARKFVETDGARPSSERRYGRAL